MDYYSWRQDDLAQDRGWYPASEEVSYPRSRWFYTFHDVFIPYHILVGQIAQFYRRIIQV